MLLLDAHRALWSRDDDQLMVCRHQLWRRGYGVPCAKVGDFYTTSCTPPCDPLASGSYPFTCSFIEPYLAPTKISD